MTMIEKVARAICKSRDALNWDAHPHEQMMLAYGDEARAAIEAMMEPSEAMKTAATEMLHDEGVTDLETVFKSMLKAALEAGDDHD